MNRLVTRIRDYLYNVEIDINERLSNFFINIGIIAAILGVIICLLSRIPVTGTIFTALIAVGAPLVAAITRHSGHRDLYGSLVAIMIIIMIPIVWLTAGAFTGGVGFWFLYVLFYIMLFTRKKQILPYCLAAFFVQAAVIVIYELHPEMFFQFTDQTHALISKIGCGVVVTIEIMITVYVQKSLYIHEREINTKSRDMTRDFVTSIANTIDTKDPYTGGHSRRVAECAAAIALKLGMSQAEADNVYFVALLHDIGKIGIPDHVLNKPGRLTAAEFTLIKKHPVYGAEILKEITMIPHVHDGVLYHHERYDGKGYPEGLKGEAIPFIARLISVADSYDAMSTTRVYRRYIRREEIINEIIRCSGTQFDPHIAAVFLKMLQEGFRIGCSSEYEKKDMDSGLPSEITRPMQEVLENDQQAEKENGATVVRSEDFAGMYDYLNNLSIRYGDRMVLASIGLDPAISIPDNEAMRLAMSNLNDAILRNIRKADIFTRSSADSYLVLLMNAPQDSAGHIFNRISADFYHMQGHRDTMLCHSIVEVDTQKL